MGKGMFVFRTVNEIPFYSCRAFEKIPGLRHGFSTRLGGQFASPERGLNLGDTAWDIPERVDENKHRYLSALHLQACSLVTLRQVHSCRIHIIKEIPGQWNPSPGDAMVTCLSGIALAVRTADCLPVLIADPDTGAVAAVHSGWRGTLQTIAYHTVRDMQRFFGSNPARLQAAIGPGIRSCCFEVGPEVSDLFLVKFSGRGVVIPATETKGKCRVNLSEALKIQLRDAGMHPKNINDIELCTCCNTDRFFSYRAEGERSGRMMAVIGRT
jgi:YfiH family protein